MANRIRDEQLVVRVAALLLRELEVEAAEEDRPVAHVVRRILINHTSQRLAALGERNV
jgi:hypothetical protein